MADDEWLGLPSVYTTEERRGTHNEVGDDGMELAEEPSHVRRCWEVLRWPGETRAVAEVDGGGWPRSLVGTWRSPGQITSLAAGTNDAFFQLRNRVTSAWTSSRKKVRRTDAYGATYSERGGIHTLAQPSQRHTGHVVVTPPGSPSRRRLPFWRAPSWHGIGIKRGPLLRCAFKRDAQLLGAHGDSITDSTFTNLPPPSYPYCTSVFPQKSCPLSSTSMRTGTVVKLLSTVDKVYDVTELLDEHPGGSKIIFKYAGKDATEAYEPSHPPDAIQNNLPIEKHVRAIDPNTVVKVIKEVTEEDKRRQALMDCRPPLEKILNLHDFEAVAKAVLPSKAWAYYTTLLPRTTRSQYARIVLRTKEFGSVISATALGKLGHADGELNLTKAAGKHGLIQMPLFLKLYLNRDREITKNYVQHAEKRGVKALFITVDAPQLGCREQDMRMKFVDDGAGAKVQERPTGRQEGSRGCQSLHTILNGVATPEDAILAYEAGCQGIVLSNYGGRQLDTSRSGIATSSTSSPRSRPKGGGRTPTFAVFVDGGVRRASDVLKAISLGASAVGVGRGFLYAFLSYGQEGVERAFEILRDECAMNMRLIGARTISEIVPEMVDASALRAHAGLTPSDNLYNTIYQPLSLAAFKNAKL
ncbi:hypothetical protein BJ912DRAFT_1059289 [Pholiota molesta]|nr:hypothetical protein BJ912DRAFT_1059289 [Pholiota molesta]